MPMLATHKVSSSEASGMWSAAEHERFLEAMTKYPRGPWRQITEHVGSRSIKQVQTHAQKYQQKVLRHQRGLRKTKSKANRTDHRVDSTTTNQFTSGCIVRKSYTPVQASSVLHPPSSSASSLSTFASTIDVLAEAARYPPESLNPLAIVDPVHYHSGYKIDQLCGHGKEAGAQYGYDAGTPSASLVSGIEPMPYAYGGYVAPPLWSERDALALRETLEVLLV